MCYFLEMQRLGATAFHANESHCRHASPRRLITKPTSIYVCGAKQLPDQMEATMHLRLINEDQSLAVTFQDIERDGLARR
jgi:hypothetical protein